MAKYALCLCKTSPHMHDVSIYTSFTLAHNNVPYTYFLKSCDISAKRMIALDTTANEGVNCGQV